jgi:hypothetical protein
MLASPGVTWHQCLSRTGAGHILDHSGGGGDGHLHVTVALTAITPAGMVTLLESIAASAGLTHVQRLVM